MLMIDFVRKARPSSRKRINNVKYQINSVDLAESVAFQDIKIT